MFIWPPFFFDGLFVFSQFSGQSGYRYIRKIDGALLGYGVELAQKMAPNGLRENRKLYINTRKGAYGNV